MIANQPTAEPEAEKQAFSAPSISLPKGGGAIRGIGEKFAANPVTGTGSLSVPLAASPGRSGFGPQLSLSYDSGAGNGPFGFGWSLALPQISRKTDKGLPRYLDADESDVYVLSGAEDLVPLLGPDGSRFEDTIHYPGYTVHRYRPRIEGLFARLERWTSQANGEVHWRSISRENIITLYGKSDASRIADPQQPERVFAWLICESYDDKGNAILYEYKAEDSHGVDGSRAHEHNRSAVSRSANRYLKRIKYGNRTPYRPAPVAGLPATSLPTDWLFEVVFDYGEHDLEAPTPAESAAWPGRPDPFSTYRPGFEVRTYRLCQRVLMFHHFPAEQGVGADCLVRSTDLHYAYEDQPADPRNPIYSFLRSVTQSGYKRLEGGGYLKKSMPPLEFEYSQPTIQENLQEVDPHSLENLPSGLDGGSYQWLDVDGEGLPGILTRQAGGWFYKRNLSPLGLPGEDGAPAARFGALERVLASPSPSDHPGGRQQFMDLAGDGQLDLVTLEGPLAGFFERADEATWEPFVPFKFLPTVDWGNPNLRFVDLTGDGHSDLLFSEDHAWLWRPSLGEAGFGPAENVLKTLDEEQGPGLIFSDPTQSIYLADMSGDGLMDIVRLSNGEVCYWPNLGYGRFGARVTMDDSPWFDAPDLFDQRRIRLADIDGSGSTDIIYLGGDGVRVYFNQSGNAWGQAQRLPAFPAVDDLAAVQALDLLGNGTACVVWSSPLPGDARRPMRYLDLMGGQKPHLLIKSANNLGAETRVHYAPSTRFYLADKLAGRPWVTRIPFPVHVVERVETYDHVSRNRFVTRYAYHHGYFDGLEREFRGFGLVEQWDTEQYAALMQSQDFPAGDNTAESSHSPPVLTKTWFHTGAYLDRQHISDFYAGMLDEDDTGEYYREPLGQDDAQARALLLEDTLLPEGLTAEEEREACRALKGAMLRQEVYALDATDKETHPYTITEQNFTIHVLQRRNGNRQAVFFTHAREAINYHYERNPADPRIAHTLTLQVDDYGNILQSATVGYGRRQPDPSLSTEDQARQIQYYSTLTENSFTNAIDLPDDFHTPLPAETCSYELTGLELTAGVTRYRFDEMQGAAATAQALTYEQTPTPGVLEKRLIEGVRTLYRPNDLGSALGDPLALLPLGQLESLALPGESYKLAFTPGLINSVYGDKVTDAILEGEGRYVHSQGDESWWLPSGRIFHSPDARDDPAVELAYAGDHFFLPQRLRDPFHRPGFETESLVTYDAYDLLLQQTRDAFANTVSVINDYRVLQPVLMIDPNGNQATVAIDVLGMVTGTALMGKPGAGQGDSLDNFQPDLDDATIAAHQADPFADPHAILQGAATRLVYDLFAYQRSQDQSVIQPPVVYSLARETHAADLEPGQQTRVLHSFSYSDGFGREIQRKIQAEPGQAPLRDAQGRIIVGADGQPQMSEGEVNPRWAGNGWTIFNNKGKAIRQYEPFFSDTHQFDFDVRIGVSPVVFYDPLQRPVGALNPNHTWQKVIFDAWRQETWDPNDTVLIADPAGDPNVGDFFRRLPEAETLPTWHAARINGGLGQHEQATAEKAAAHAGTPAVAHLDALGRTFLTITHNRIMAENGLAVDEFSPNLVVYDIEGNPLQVIDAKGRVVMQYDYDMLGNVIHSTSMDAGQRWLLNDAAGQPVHAWDGRGHAFRTEYDPLHRPLRQYVQGVDPTHSDGRVLDREVLYQKIEYGEGQADDSALNLRTRVWRIYDGAGVATSAAYDFKGNLLRSTRQLAVDYQNTPDWAEQVELETQVYASSTVYDALNRPISLTAPDNSEIKPIYNQANLLEQVQARLRGAAQWTTFVNDIDYNAKGQREQIEYGNGVMTSYAYDPLTNRLARLETLRGSERLQDLAYSYDPVGNITHIQDEAQQTIFFNNNLVEPHSDYIYDALYQLIRADGREHIGQAGQVDPHDPALMPLPHPNNGQALRRYSQQYTYDAVGNLLKMAHSASGGSWTQLYEYAADSNRLLATSLPGDDPGGPYSAVYPYNAHGSMTAMPHLQSIGWDFKEMLQQVDLGGGGSAFYVYDAAGQRARKVHEHNGSTVEERIYLGGWEIYRKRVAGQLRLERQTLHILDGAKRIALVETKTLDEGALVPSPTPLVRYQLDNHLGSACLELNETANVITYEEYYPYGATSYHAVNGSLETSPRRYRYTGKEKDEETGLYYHGARYYACWLGRWVSADPGGLVDGPNVFAYTQDNPICKVDADGKESFNSGEQLERYRDPDGNRYVQFRATKNTWISASAKSLGLDKYYTKEQGYGAYVEGVVFDSNGEAFADPDKLEVGEIYYIRIGPILPDPETEPVAEPEPAPEPEGWGKFIFRNVVDLVIPDKVAAEIHGGVGVEALEAITGGQIVGEVSVAGTLITLPNSQDFMKSTVNISVGVSPGLKFGTGQTTTVVTPVGNIGVSFTAGEFFGHPSKATLESIPGHSVGASLGAEGKLGIGLKGAGIASVSIPNEGYATWVDTGVDIQGRGSDTFNLTGEIGGNYKYTFPSVLTLDLMPGFMRDYHKKYVNWVQAGTMP